MNNDILQQQIEYYRARAAEYDEWFYRTGRYNHGAAENQQWADEAQQVRAALLNLPNQAHVLELASGTGIWTLELLKLADRLTAVDASPEMIAIHRAKVQSENVTYVQADLFTWQPPEAQYDMVFFSFWLSHVPPEHLAEFLSTVSRALKPGGYFFMVDSRRAPTSSAKDHIIPDDGTTLTRRLNDGREFDIVKVFYEPEALRQHLAQAGIQAQVQVTPAFFLYAHGQKV
jgi:ubiquinone/menaquinone biosynthesis C-methylase UbiE